MPKRKDRQGGRGAHDRGALKAAVKGSAAEEAKKLHVSIPVPTSVVKDVPHLVTPSEKFAQFWTSTVLWSGITMLGGILLTRLSVLLAYVLAWVLILVEFIRIDFFRRRLSKALGPFLFALALAGVMFGVWKVTPQPQQEPSLDQVAQRAVSDFAKQFPWLTEGPQPPIEPRMIVASPMRRPWMLLKLTGIHGGGEGALLTHSLSIEEAEINAGDAIAKDITGFGDLFFGPAGAATEDAIFKKLPQMPTDKTSMHDQLPGKENAYTIVVGHPGSPIDVDPIDEPADTSKKLFSGSYMLYVVVRVNYRDTSGRPHTTEQCLVGTNLEDNMGYCIGHNGMN